MKEIKIGEKVIRVRATPLALLFYKQEFKCDLLGELLKMAEIEKDNSKLDTVAIMQLVWAMNKADNYGDQFPCFVKWLAEFESIDFADHQFLSTVMEEAQEGFFRSGKGKFKNKKS